MERERENVRERVSENETGRECEWETGREGRKVMKKYWRRSGQRPRKKVKMNQHRWEELFARFIFFPSQEKKNPQAVQQHTSCILHHPVAALLWFHPLPSSSLLLTGTREREREGEREGERRTQKHIVGREEGTTEPWRETKTCISERTGIIREREKGPPLETFPLQHHRWSFNQSGNTTFFSHSRFFVSRSLLFFFHSLQLVL